jgi:hypothetical protein
MGARGLFGQINRGKLQTPVLFCYKSIGDCAGMAGRQSVHCATDTNH